MRRDWSNLPEEIISLITNRSSLNNFDRLCIRSLCKSWRSSISSTITANTALPKSFLLTDNPYPFYDSDPKSRLQNQPHFISQVFFFKINLSNSSENNKKGWLIKIKSGNKSQLISPLSGFPINSYTKTLDLLRLKVSEISTSYQIETRFEPCPVPTGSWSIKKFERAVIVEGKEFRVFIIDCKKIWYCSNQTKWYEIENEFNKNFSDITLYKGLLYALDFNGAIWWISLSSSDFSIYPYAPAPVTEIEGEMVFSNRFVEINGELCIVSCRKVAEFVRNEEYLYEGIGFRVYKMDEEVARLEEVMYLGGMAIFVAEEMCLCVKKSDFYGCLGNVIYFDNERNVVKMFKLEDGSVCDMNESCSVHTNVFKMFCSCFSS